MTILSLLLGVILMTSTAIGSNLVSAQSKNDAGTIVVQTIPGQSIAQKISKRAEASWPWYVTRASGIVAAAALFILILSGIGLVSGGMFRFLEPLTAWASHRALGITFAVASLIHMSSLLFDHFVSFSVLDLFVPWLSTYKPVTIAGIQLGSLFVALGVLSFYGAALIIITSLAWIDKKPKFWKIMHFMSYVVLLFVYVHALYLGTDFAGGIMRLILVAIGFIIALALLYRLWRAKTI